MTHPISNQMVVGELRDLADKQPAKTGDPNPAAARRETAGSDHVTLTPEVRQLNELVHTAAAEPDVDRARVSALRESIARGDYQVDSAAIARRMVDFEHLLSPQNNEVS